MSGYHDRLDPDELAYLRLEDRIEHGPMCVVCDDRGCEHCPAVRHDGDFTDLVDQLQALNGLDRDEAELLATVTLFGEENGG